MEGTGIPETGTTREDENSVRTRMNKKVVASALAAVAAGVTFAIVPSSPALAWGCSASRDWTQRYGAVSRCDSETFRWWHQVWITCDEGPMGTNTHYGNYAGAKSESKAQCGQSTVSVIAYGVNQGQDD